MATAAVTHDHVEPPTCWCCGHTFQEQDLARLGAHPEVKVCAGCAHWLHRRARASADAGAHTPAAMSRRGVAAVRGRVMRAGLQDRAVLGPILRRLNRFLP